MSKCPTIREALRSRKAAGWTKPALKALREYMEAKSGQALHPLATLGKISWGVSDKVPDGRYSMGIETTFSNDVEYAQGEYLTRVVNQDDLITLQVSKPVSTVEQAKIALKAADPSLDVAKATTYAELRKELMAAGYDAIVTREQKLIVADDTKVTMDTIPVYGEVSPEIMTVGFDIPRVAMGLDIDSEIDLTRPVDAVKLRYGNTLPVVRRGESHPRNETILEVEVGNNTITVYTPQGRYIFRHGNDESMPTKHGYYVTVSGMGSLSYDINQYDGYVLGSAEGEVISGDLVEDVHGKTASMVEFMKKLNEISGAKADTEFLQYLENLITHMDETFFTEMKTYLDTKANDTRGEVVRESGVPSPEDSIRVQIDTMQHAGNDQSGAEVYAHEVVHAYTIWALESIGSKADDMRRRLRDLRTKTRDALNKKYNGEGWKVFMPDESIDAKLEERAAKDAWKYVFDNSSKNATAEFLAYMTTNPQLVRAAKELQVKEEGQTKRRTIFQWLTDIMEVIADVITGRIRVFNKSANIQEEVLDLMYNLGKINNKAQVKINENESALNRIAKWFDSIDEATGNKVAEYWNKKTRKLMLNYKPMPVGKGRWAMAKWFVRYVPTIMTNKELRPTMVIVLKMLGLDTTGIVQNILRDFQSSDDLKVAIHEQMRLAGKIDRIREALVKSYSEAIDAGFSEKLTTEQKEAITEVIIDTDMQSIWEEYTTEEIAEMLENEAVLEKNIETAISQLQQVNPRQANWNTAQAKSLGYFMVTGLGHKAQNVNAENIARGVMQFDDRRTPLEGEVAAIDKVATLTALKHANVYGKKRVAKLVRSETKGMQNVINQHKYFVDASRKELFDGSEKLMMKGYSKEIFNDSIAIEVAPAANEVEMRQKGYVKIKDFKVDETIGPQRMALYKSEAFNRQEYYRATVKLTGTGRRGTSMMQVAMDNYGTKGMHVARMAKKRADIERKKIVLKMEKGEFDPNEVTYGAVPAVDTGGNVIDYRYMMSKKDKKKVLEQDTDVAKVMGRSIGTIYDRVSTEEHNENVLKLILDDQDVNYVEGEVLGNNGYTYIEIGAKADNKKGREIWKMLPSAMQKSIQNKGYQKIAVREDMVEEYFGFRQWSAANMGVMKFFPEIVRTAVKLLEEMWMSVVAVAKVDILIRMPFVMIGNIVNNIVYGIQTGSGPREIIKLYTTQMRNIMAYMKDHKKLVDLEAAKNAGNINNKDLAEMESLRSSLEENPIHELFEVGIYESIVEDLNEGEAKEKGILNAWVQEKAKNAPDWARTSWDWFTLNRNTAWYRNMEMMLRMGDLVGQAVENEKRKIVDNKKLTEMELSMRKDGVPAQKIAQVVNKEKKRLDSKRLAELNEEFIFYSAPASANEEYMNRMGLVMFTKFYKRYQKVVMKSAINRPLRTLLLTGVDQFLFDDALETPVDQLAFVKMVDGRALSMFQHPLNLLHLNTPIGLRAAMGTL